jgi:hypothetical protein
MAFYDLRHAFPLRKTISVALEAAAEPLPWETPDDLLKAFMKLPEEAVEIKYHATRKRYCYAETMIAELDGWWVALELERIRCPSGGCNSDCVVHTIVGKTRQQLDREIRWISCVTP